MKIPDLPSFFRDHQISHVTTWAGWVPSELFQAECVLPSCTSSVTSPQDWFQSHVYQVIPEVHARQVFSFHRLAQGLAGNGDTEASSLCQRKFSLHRGPEPICSWLSNSFLGTVGCVDYGEVLESVIGTHVTMKQVVYRLALGNSKCEASASCRGKSSTSVTSHHAASEPPG